MPSSKSSRTAGSATAEKNTSDRQRAHKPPPKPGPKPKGGPPDTLFAEPPIVVTSGSVMIELDKSIFPQEPSNPNQHKNANRKLSSIEIQSLASPPVTLMTVDLKSLAGGKCKILIKYEK